MYAAANDLRKDAKRRRVLTWTDHDLSPFNVKGVFWGNQPDWKLIRYAKGFAIKNVEFEDYLYADADDFTSNLRSVYTRNYLGSAGDDGLWVLQERV